MLRSHDDDERRRRPVNRGSVVGEEAARAAAAVDADALLADARRLVRIPTYGGRERPAQEAMAELMDAAGLETDVWEIDLPFVQRHEASSWEIERPEALGVVGTLPGTGGGPTLVLNGHVDVVPPGAEGLWTRPPFDAVVEEGRLYGRGALDMKGPLIAGLHALAAVRRTGIPLPGTVKLQSVVAEEDGGLGTLASILRGHVGDAAIVMEPTELAIAPIQAGCLNFRVTVPGSAAHGAVRDEGVSAFEKMFGVYQAICDLERARNRVTAGDPLFDRYRIPFPISIGTLHGGDWASSVPDHVAMEGRLGVRPDEALEDARSELEGAVAAVATSDPFLAEHAPVVTWWGGRFLPARTPVTAPVVGALTAAVRSVTGRPERVEAVPFGADAGLLEHVGGMEAVLFGAGDIRRAHRPDEFIDVQELVTMSRVLAATIVRFCSL
jgi:acetylornithine deacetylase